MPAVRVERSIEAETVYRWRLYLLEQAGYSLEAADVLAVCDDVDLHDAVALLKDGCPERLAIRILL